MTSTSSSTLSKRQRTETSTDDNNITIGVIALQGAIIEHITKLQQIEGVTTIQVRSVEDLQQCDGIIIPGGESTVIGRLAASSGLLEPLRQWTLQGKPTYGTCAGMIMMANRVEGLSPQRQELLGGLDITVRRNYFGSQLGSLTQKVHMEDSSTDDSTFPAVFIRAPAVLDVGKGVEILAKLDHYQPKSNEACDKKGQSVIVAVKQGNLLATAFHPELNTDVSDVRWHQKFVDIVRKAKVKE
jgi:5'-phosphate synthase pdxT subunit